CLPTLWHTDDDKAKTDRILRSRGTSGARHRINLLTIMFITGREDFSFRVGVASMIAAAFLGVDCLCARGPGRIRQLFFYVIVQPHHWPYWPPWRWRRFHCTSPTA